jgi:hypothetical protein
MDELTLHTPEPETEAAVDPTPDQIMAQCVAIESEKRKWLRGITSFLAGRSREADPSSSVQTAADQATIAAYDRVARMLRSDDPIDIV